MASNARLQTSGTNQDQNADLFCNQDDSIEYGRGKQTEGSPQEAVGLELLPPRPRVPPS